jgi:hypothetical protein
MIIRELVRLHEHTHAIFHTTKLEKIHGVIDARRLGIGRNRFQVTYTSFPRDIDEPMGEFIAWSTICNEGSQMFKNIFREVDKKSPRYYRRWIEIKELVDEKCEPPPRNYLFFVPALIHIAREGNWKDFDDFIYGVEKQFYLIYFTYKIISAACSLTPLRLLFIAIPEYLYNLPPEKLLQLSRALSFRMDHKTYRTLERKIEVLRKLIEERDFDDLKLRRLFKTFDKFVE